MKPLDNPYKEEAEAVQLGGSSPLWRSRVWVGDEAQTLTWDRLYQATANLAFYRGQQWVDIATPRAAPHIPGSYGDLRWTPFTPQTLEEHEITGRYTAGLISKKRFKKEIRMLRREVFRGTPVR